MSGRDDLAAVNQDNGALKYVEIPSLLSYRLRELLVVQNLENKL